MPSDKAPNAVLLAVAKNEAPYFLEWIAYHKLIGFQNIIIFQNNSDDGTGEILRCLAASGEIQYLYNRAKAGAHQVRAYKRAASLSKYIQSDWAMALDLDEFLHIKVGSGTLSDLFERVPEADEFIVNWRVFGNSGLADLEDDLVTRRFTQCEPSERITNRFTGHKTLYKTSWYERAGIHHPVGLKIPESEICTVNGSGLPEDQFEKRNWRSKDRGQRSLAQINHYMVKDAASFVLKTMRGSAHQAGRDIGRKYWEKRNFNGALDGLLGLKSDIIWSEIARMDAASGGKLVQLHDQAVRIHQKKFQASQEIDELRDLYEFCKSVSR